MKKAKSLILSSVLVCLLAVAMILTMVPTNIMASLGTNLGGCAEEVDPNYREMRVTYHGFGLYSDQPIDLSQLTIEIVKQDGSVDESYAYINAWTVDYSYWNWDDWISFDVADNTGSFSSSCSGDIKVSYEKEFEAEFEINFNEGNSSAEELPYGAPENLTATFIKSEISVNQSLSASDFDLSGTIANTKGEAIDFNEGQTKYIYNGQEIDLNTFTIPASLENKDLYITVSYTNAGVTVRDTVKISVTEATPVATNMTATYGATIIVGSTINPSEIDIVVLDQNDNDMNIGAGEVTYWYAGNLINNPQNYVFNVVGSFDITVEYETLQATMTVDVIKGPAESLTAIYNGTITKGEKLDLSKILIQEKNANGVVIKSYCGNDADEGNRIVYRDMEMNIFDYANETFDVLGEVQIKLGKELQPESPHTYTTMTVNVVEAPVVEEPEPEPIPTPTPTPEQPEQPENPSVDQPVVEQPATEDNDGNGLNVGAILGIVFGSLAVLGLGGSLLWIFVFRK